MFIQKYGLILSFLNEIKDLLPRNQISTKLSKDEDLSKLYYIGQLVKCRVFEFDKEKASLITDEKDEQQEETDVAEFEQDYEIGDLIESDTVLQVYS